MSCTVVLECKNEKALEQRSESLDMTPQEYVTLCLNVCEQLPKSLLFTVAAGVPVSFCATAEVGEMFDGS